jgi:hypothetical protein
MSEFDFGDLALKIQKKDLIIQLVRMGCPLEIVHDFAQVKIWMKREIQTCENAILFFTRAPFDDEAYEEDQELKRCLKEFRERLGSFHELYQAIRAYLRLEAFRKKTAVPVSPAYSPNA